MNLKKVFLAISLTHLIIFPSISANISGRILNENKEPIQNLFLFLSNGNSSQTNEKGVFIFENLMPGSYQLNSEIGSQLVAISGFDVKEKNSGLNLGDIIIPKNIQLKEIVVSENQISRQIERLPDIKGTFIYAGKKNEVVRLSNHSANLAQNISRQVFAKVPGIQVWESDGSGVQMGISARGLSPNRMWEFNTRQNGYDISSDPFGYPEAYYTPSVESLDRIEIIRGAASLQYGPQFGGVINYIKKQSISGKKIGVESQQTIGSYGMMSSFNAIGGNHGKFSYYSNINLRKSNGWRENNRYNTWNGFVNLGYQFNKNLKASIEYTRMDQLVQQPGGTTDSIFNINPQNSTRSRNWFDLIWNMPAMNIDYQINSSNKLNVKAFGLIGFRNSIGNLSSINVPDTASSTDGTYSTRRIDMDAYKNMGLEIRHLFSYKIRENQNSLAVGIRYYTGNTDRIRNMNGNKGSNYDLTTLSDQLSIDMNFETQNTAVYAENLFNINSRFSITPGFRYEILNNNVEGKYASAADATIPKTSSQRQFLLLGLGTQYKVSGSTNVYANFTQAYRPVLFSDITPSATSDSIDKNLVDAKGYNIDLGYRGNITKLISFDASLFYLLYDNRIGSYMVNSRNFRTNIGTSISKGFEGYFEITPTSLLDDNKFGELSIFACLSFIDAKYTSWNNPDLSKSQKDKKIENAPNYIHRFGIAYGYKTIKTSLQLSSIGSTFTDAMNTEKPDAKAQVGIIPAYSVIDWSFSFKLLKNYNVNGGVNNLMNTMYFTRRAGGYPGPGVLPADGRIWYFGAGVKF